MRFALLIALGLVFAAGLATGAQLITRDDAAPRQAPAHARTAATPDESVPRTAAKNTAPAGARDGRGRVTAPLDHRGREGIEEAEVDSHENASGAGG